MSPEKREISGVLQCYNDALNAAFMGIDRARALVASMQSDGPVLRDSLGTPHFLSTFDLIARLSKARRTASNSDFIDAIPDLAQVALRDLSKYVAEEPDKYLIPAYRLACSFASLQDSGFTAIVSKVFAENFNRLMAAQELTDKDAQVVIKHVIETATPQQIRALTRAAISPDSALSRRFPRQIDSLLNLGILGNNTYERPERMSAVLDELTSEQSTRLLNAWDDSQGKRKDRSKGSEAIYFEYFSTVCRLEQLRPGITKYLIDNYGILAFARYPLDLLTEQYDTREEKDVPYTILVAARHDHNGAMLFLKDEISCFHKQAKALGIRLKICEAENLEGIIQTTNTVAYHHGQISCVLLVEHELDAGISELEWDRSIFTSSAVIGLISCFTGAENGTAQLLSLTLQDVDIHAPDYEAYLKKGGIQFDEDDGVLNIRVLFGYGEGNYITEEDILYALTSSTEGRFNIRTSSVNLYDVPTRVYRNGQLVRDYI
ncbi:hypothetical protein HY386_02140 [Candidatus Daviesbacteria bacterium]|nr:hypothetical protein [Candidatus Daviesbacteria bacterium]